MYLWGTRILYSSQLLKQSRQWLNLIILWLDYDLFSICLCKTRLSLCIHLAMHGLKLLKFRSFWKIQMISMFAQEYDLPSSLKSWPVNWKFFSAKPWKIKGFIVSLINFIKIQLLRTNYWRCGIWSREKVSPSHKYFFVKLTKCIIRF